MLATKWDGTGEIFLFVGELSEAKAVDSSTPQKKTNWHVLSKTDLLLAIESQQTFARQRQPGNSHTELKKNANLLGLFILVHRSKTAQHRGVRRNLQTGTALSDLKVDFFEAFRYDYRVARKPNSKLRLPERLLPDPSPDLHSRF